MLVRLLVQKHTVVTKREKSYRDLYIGNDWCAGLGLLNDVNVLQCIFILSFKINLVPVTRTIP